jgi:sortase A
MITPDAPTRTVWLWALERTCIAAALVCGGWTLLSTAESQFYRSLPVPSSFSVVRQLPGDAGAGPAIDPITTSASAPRHPGDWVARLEAPAAGLSATVIEGSTDDMLARAAGHIENTALPGEPGNVGIAGHRDTTFRAVRTLVPGDTITLTSRSGRFDYRVTQTFIVTPDTVSVLNPTSHPSLTLVTCYPFTFIGHAPMRYIVRAEQQGPNAS